MKSILLASVACITATLAHAETAEDKYLEWDSGVPVGPIEPMNQRLEQGQVDPVAGSAQNDIVQAAYDAPEKMSLTFIFHIDEDLTEQDVFFEKVPGSDEVFRPTKATRDMGAPLFAAGTPVPHTPLQVENTGPFPKGKPLGITLGDWFAAEGGGSYVCENGTGKVDLTFENLVPNGLYTLWHDFAVWPPTDPFLGFYDVPFGARDGSENAFVADASGNAHVVREITPCLQLSGEQLISELAIAWHSDGNTYGPLPGTFSTVTHVQMYVTLPKRTGL